MDGEPSFWFALACEDREHHRAVTRLTDWVLTAHVDWFTPATRDAIPPLADAITDQPLLDGDEANPGGARSRAACPRALRQ